MKAGVSESSADHSVATRASTPASSPQAEYALAVHPAPGPSVTSGESHQPRSDQVQARQFDCRKKPILLHRCIPFEKKSTANQRLPKQPRACVSLFSPEPAARTALGDSMTGDVNNARGPCRL